MKVLLTGKATSTGGRNGKSTTSGGKTFEMAMPGSNKTGDVTNPEELFALGYSACFNGALAKVAEAEKIDTTNATVAATVNLNSDTSGFFLSVELNVTVPGVDNATAEQLVQKAHHVCPYSKATRGNVEVTLKVNDKPLAKAA